jgi:tetratricopeptide (TPR) repeat protein
LKPEVCLTVIFGLALSVCLPASQQQPIRGEVDCPKCPPGSSLYLEVFDQISHTLIDRTLVRPTGDFELLQTPEGVYEVQILTRDGEVLKSQAGMLTNRSPLTMRVDLPEKAQVSSGTISLGRLRHKVPRKAVAQFKKAEKKVTAGDPESAIEYLQNAISIDPDYMEAHNNLGVRYMKANKPEQAVPYFRRAIELDPGIGLTYVNLAIALLKAKSPAEAEVAARRAVDLDGRSANSRYVLGMSLFAQQKSAPEALENLKLVENEFPESRLVVAQLLIGQGRVEQARTALKSYVSSGSPERRKEVEGWLSRLK